MSFLPSTHYFNIPQQRALAIIPHVTGPLSMLGSALIIRDVVYAKDSRLSYHRLLLGMSCCDFLASFWFSLSTAPMPRGTIHSWGAVGTTSTCTAQGFFIQTSVGTAIYNASLAVYYLLMGRYEWTEERIQKVEKFMHAVPILVGYGTAGAGLAMNLFHSATLWCWIAPRPSNCEFVSSDECVFDMEPCPFRWSMFYFPLWACIAIAMIAMALVYWTVLQQERAVDAYQPSGIALRERSKRVAKQSFWYIFAFYLSWAGATAYSLLEAVNSGKKIAFSLAVVVTIFTPMQGFLNFLVYFRAKYNLYRREHPDEAALDAMKEAAWNPSVKKKGGLSIPDTEMDTK